MEALNTDPIALGFLFALLAGLSTGIGSIVAYFIRKPKLSYLSTALGFSGGAMVYVSFVELIPVSIVEIGELAGIICFFAGILLIAIIDFLIPEIENPHHPVDAIVYSNHECKDHEKTDPTNTPEETSNQMQQTPLNNIDSPPGRGFQGEFHHHRGMRFHHRSKHRHIHRFNPECQDAPRLWKMSMLTAITIAIHNFPEGIAAFGITLYDVRLGFVIAAAIAIHNIPEGISVAIPIFYATNSRKKAVLYSFLSGFAEPLGAVIGFVILYPFLSPALLAGLSAFVAGIMVYISIDEILPTAHHYGHGHAVIIGLVLGMAVMAISLLFL